MRIMIRAWYMYFWYRHDDDDDDDNGIDTTKNPKIRIVQNENEVRHDPPASYRALLDTVDLAHDALGANSVADFI